MRITAASATVLVLLFLVEPVFAQTRSGGSGGSSSGSFGSSSGGFGSSGGSGGGGSSGGSGFGGSGTGGFGSSGSSGGSGSFAGGSGGNFTGGTTSGSSFLRGGSRTTQSTDPTYKYNGNPLAIGLASPTSNSSGSQYLRQFPVQLSFGNPIYGNITTSTGLTGGTATLGLGTGSPFAGANNLGIRRAPAYTVSLAFDTPPPRANSVIRTDLQQIIAQSSRLPSRGNIRVTMDGETVVLRGRVTNDRERRLAEALVRLTPGVRAVRNDITVPTGGGGG